jgi:hypothetical protein
MPHVITERATPEMHSMYKLSFLLNKSTNDSIPHDEWTPLIFDQILTLCQKKICKCKYNSLKVEINALGNIFNYY